MFDKIFLYFIVIEDVEYKQEKINCKQFVRI